MNELTLTILCQLVAPSVVMGLESVQMNEMTQTLLMGTDEVQLALLNQVFLEMEVANMDRIHASLYEVMALVCPQRTEMMAMLQAMTAAQIYEWLKTRLHDQVEMRTILMYAMNSEATV